VCSSDLFAPAVPTFHDGAFTVVRGGRRHATPLLLVLVAIEASDLVFAVDSIPAIFGITDDPFIVFTSNIFAILGLRALYFVLGGFLGRFRYLDKGLALVLLFVGGKMLLAGVVHVSTPVSLAVVAGVIGGAVLVSVARRDATGPHRDRN
jgi:tellurite resistance protein TerC